MNVAYAVGFFPTAILDDARDVDDYTALIAWFQMFLQAITQECFVSTVQEESFHQDQLANMNRSLGI
jgi:hypothetical protein